MSAMQNVSDRRYPLRTVKKEEPTEQALSWVSHCDDDTSNLFHSQFSASNVESPSDSQNELRIDISSRLKPNGEPKRPRNAFIWFRTHVERQRKKLTTTAGQSRVNQCNVSEEAAVRWKALTADEQEPYYALADAEKQEYALLFPGYKYAPLGKPAVRRRMRVTPNSDATRSSVESLDQDEYQPSRPTKRKRLEPSTAKIARRPSIAAPVAKPSTVKMALNPVPVQDPSRLDSPAPKLVPESSEDTLCSETKECSPSSLGGFFFDIDASGDIHLEDIIDSQFIGPQDPEIVQETCEADLADLDYFMILDGPRPDDCGLFLHPTWTESMEAVVGEMFDVGLLELNSLDRALDVLAFWMHFSKTYAQLLLELPPELRDNAIQYRQLKKLINKVVYELEGLGLGHDVLQQLFQPHSVVESDDEKADSPSVVYEFNSESGQLEPRLRLYLNTPTLDTPSDSPPVEAVDQDKGHLKLLWAIQDGQAFESISSPAQLAEPQTASLESPGAGAKEVIIPLASDSAFFTLLATALQSISIHSETMRTDFHANLLKLAQMIGKLVRPPSSSNKHNAKEIYAWRDIFKLYIEAEVFETVGTPSKEMSIEDSEQKLKLFAERVAATSKSGLSEKKRLKSKTADGRDALESFLEANLFILNVKKFQAANAEATRKILKKHAKRTALPLPDLPTSLETPTLQLDDNPRLQALSLILSPHAHSSSLPRLLVQAIGETVLPIIPHIDDYSCLICTEIAFKPIRLGCGHLFCVRCLVIMQKKGQGHCPLCRRETILAANRSNVDTALTNLLYDWFPAEVKEKMKDNEEYAAREQMIELGIDPDQKCLIM